LNKTKFEDLNLNSNVLKALEDMGFETPTPIQEQAIPILLDSDLDFVGQAQTGTGKTAAFVIPLLENLSARSRSVQALILTPTRELANQIQEEIKKLGKYTKIKSTCVYGGSPYNKQIKALKDDRPQIVVGTPGRTIDLINKGILKLNNAEYCILDEADEMLNMGFFEDVETILEMFNEKRKMVMFSATMPKQILKLIDKSFNEYRLVKTKAKSLSNNDIEQRFFSIKEKYLTEGLTRLIDVEDDLYAMVFCRTKIETKKIGADLMNLGHKVEVLNGDMSQSERDYAMRNFKNKKANIMVCTDVAARGIDVNNLTHVFNYGLPQDNESYVHRIGRTARAGMKGKAYTLVGPKMAFAIKRIEKHINAKIELEKLPSVEALKRKIVEKDVESANDILEAIKSKGDGFEVDESFDVFEKKFKGLKKEDLLKAMYTWKFNKTLRHYHNLGEIEETPGGGGGGSRRGPRRRGPSGSRSNGRSRDGNRSGGNRSGGGRRSEGRDSNRRSRSRDGNKR